MSTWELIECARINFENLGKLVSGIKEHPMYKIVEAQLTIAANQAEEEDRKMEARETADRT